MRKKSSVALVVVVLVLLLSLLLASTALADPAPSTVATGLDNPRGLRFGPEGALYVAEAGSGGNGPCVADPEGGLACFGLSGAITRVNLKKGTQERVVENLPSLGDQNTGEFAIGPVDIAFQGRGNGYVVVGLGGNPADREANIGPAGLNLGQLARMKPNGSFANVADIAAYEGAEDPLVGPEGPDSNPYSVLALPERQIVADAGGNTLLQVNAKGNIDLLAVFADRLVPAPPFLGLPPGSEMPMEAVPTSVEMGPDGNLYVGQLTGFPFPVGGANVYRVPAHGGTPEVYASGFTNIIDIAFDPHGNLYVLEIAANGLLSGDPTGGLFKVAPDGTRTELVPGALVAPGGVAWGPDNMLYVTNFSVFPGAGEVLRIDPNP